MYTARWIDRGGCMGDGRRGGQVQRDTRSMDVGQGWHRYVQAENDLGAKLMKGREKGLKRCVISQAKLTLYETPLNISNFNHGRVGLMKQGEKQWRPTSCMHRGRCELARRAGDLSRPVLPGRVQTFPEWFHIANDTNSIRHEKLDPPAGNLVPTKCFIKRKGKKRPENRAKKKK